MVASPPDSVIPYETAAVFVHGKSGHDVPWLTGRGPLVGFVNAAVLNLCGLTPADPPQADADPRHWPLDPQGFHAARVVGILTNACVLLVGGYLLSLLGATRSGGEFGLCWLALSPVVFINVA